MTLGVLGEYIALIYEEVKQRPNYVVNEVLGLATKEDFLEKRDRG
jgi:dolichol-phosphate mannosyltransferase